MHLISGAIKTGTSPLHIPDKATEKNKNGGFDGMIIIWSKLNMSETRKEKILKLLPKIIKTD